ANPPGPGGGDGGAPGAAEGGGVAYAGDGSSNPVPVGTDAGVPEAGPIASVPLATVGPRLQRSLVWSPSPDKAVVFRQSFSITAPVIATTAHIFADARYSLWINGHHVATGPNRFDPKGPEFDSIDVTSTLHAGANTVAVLAYGNLDAISGQHMKHAAGMALLLEGSGVTVSTGTTWKCSSKTRFLTPTLGWSNLVESVDATVEYDSLAEAFDDAAWGHPVVVDGTTWGPLSPRSIPLLRETPLTARLPFTLPADTGSFGATFDKSYVTVVQLDFQATAGTLVNVFGNTYKARAGRQVYRVFDPFGFGLNGTPVLNVAVTGSIHLFDIQFIGRAYPFDIQGQFASSDSRLDQLWQDSVHTVQQLSEDGYEDCPWERAIWMGDSAVVEYPLTRVALVGPNAAYGDPRLIRDALWLVAESQLPDGRIKAHAPSDRMDIHGFIEDYACLWIETLREYYDHTHDSAFLASVWPVLAKQVDWFLAKVQADGLVLAREFVIFDNPLKYQTREGTTLNAFLYKALQDSAYLAGELGKTPEAATYAKRATDLGVAVNALLWDGQAYKASTVDTLTDVLRWYANAIALSRGVVPAARLQAVQQGVASNAMALSARMMPYTHHWLLQDLYDMDSAAADQSALDVIRTRWARTYAASNLGRVTDESFGPRDFHNFGSAAAYFLAADVLGVTLDAPVWKSHIAIKPRLADLASAHGTVVTELGLVPVSWTNDPVAGLTFSFSVPAGSAATVSLPTASATPTLTVNGQSMTCVVHGRYATFDAVAGSYSGHLAR
ncbi:MAG: hypothetical protein M3O36_03550, partial [Myxococcota bacterium]|nr:hypothetical protein [Myxococcota bacterium]